MTAAVGTTTATVDGAVYRTERHASVNLCLSQPAWSTTSPRRREENMTEYLIVCSRKSEAELALDVIVLLQLLTETKHRRYVARRQATLGPAVVEGPGVRTIFFAVIYDESKN